MLLAWKQSAMRADAATAWEHEATYLGFSANSHKYCPSFWMPSGHWPRSNTKAIQRSVQCLEWPTASRKGKADLSGKFRAAQVIR